MKPLAERHAERAQRKADNMAESQDAKNYTGGIGDAANKVVEAQIALNALSEEQRNELHANFEANGGFKSLAETGNDAPGLSLAGIGTVDPRVTPLQQAFDGAGSAALTGELPSPSFDPAKGNLNGQAVEAAGTPASASGWGKPAFSDGYGALTLTELKAEADKREIAYPAKVKDDQAGKDGIIASLRADDKKKAESQGGDNS